MAALTPLGSARKRFLDAGGLSEERADEPPTLAAESDEDFEPAYLGWEIARCARGATREEQAGLVALAAACIASMRAGSTRMPLDAERLERALAVVGAGDALPVVLSIVARAREPRPHDPIAKIVGAPGERKPLVVDGGWLYAGRMRLLEERFGDRIRDRLGSPKQGHDPRAVSRAIGAVASGPPPLTEEQKRALREALGAPLALVTGAPGTGKTAVVVALLRALAWLGVRMDTDAIAAPTGKAAQRLREAIVGGFAVESRVPGELVLRETGPLPQTLHRLLGWSPRSGRFARHENDPMPFRLVVVDEASMVDLAMMDRLVRALAPGARLVLLGDADQLPSIDAGAVFRDLCAGVGAVRLSRNLRVAEEPSARSIVDAAQAVNAGATAASLSQIVKTRRSVEEIAFEGVERLAIPWDAACEAVLDAWWRLRVAPMGGFADLAGRTFRAPRGLLDPAQNEDLRALFAAHERSRVLCATRVMGQMSSTAAINERLLARLQSDQRGSPWSRGGSPLQTPGTPMVVGRNDYDRGLFNGDQGVVLRADTGDGLRPAVVFRRGDAFEALSREAVGDLSMEMAFAMTVHKAQGSEFDHVMLVLPETDIPLLTRELVYTAVTRARRSVLIVGDQDLLARAVSRRIDRHSGIAERLAPL
jgi:exodeoxyribonuclease V alpha subunit